MKANKLKGKLVERGVNVDTLAEYLGIERTTLYRKLNNFEKITIGEAIKIKAFLELPDHEAVEIFLS
jgi:plasmid maintenance system antidote protein VapI